MARANNDENWETVLRASGVALHRIQRHTPAGSAEGPQVVELRLKLEQDDATSVLVILKARGEQGMLVGFVGAPDLVTAVLSVAKKLEKGAVRWREDRPWSPAGG